MTKAKQGTFLVLSVRVPPGEHTEYVETLWEAAQSLGYEYMPKLDEYHSTKGTGKLLAIGEMVRDIAAGKLKVVKK